MRIKNIVYAIMLLGLTVSAYSYDDGDVQAWLFGGVSGEFDNGVKVGINSEYRYGDDVSEYYYTENALYTDYSPLSWLNVGAGYVESYEKFDDSYKREQQVRGEMVFKQAIVVFKVDDRVRVERRMKDGTDNYFRYRNRIRIKHPSKTVSPYVAWEMFVEDLPQDDWVLSRNRLFAGISVKVVSEIYLDVYYLKQFDWKDIGWREYNVFGGGMSVKF